jgi:hypothetical protein
MDSTEALFGTPTGRGIAYKSMKIYRSSVVARDGIEEHYTALTIPLTGICLDPALGLTNATA